MAKIYYVGGSTSSTGILRSILPVARLGTLIKSQQFAYVGATFPSGKGGLPATILEISHDERSPSWRAGFYRAQLPPLEFEEALRAAESSPEEQPSSPELVS